MSDTTSTENATATTPAEGSGLSHGLKDFLCRLCGHVQPGPADAAQHPKNCANCGGDPPVAADQVQPMTAPIVCPNCGETIVPPFTTAQAAA